MSTGCAHSHDSGFGLIEILIASAISSFLLLMISKTFLTQHQAYTWQQAASSLQENARFASLVLTQHIEKAGYIGCGRLGQLLNWSNQTAAVLAEDRFIRGYAAIDQHWQPGLPAKVDGKVVPGNDVLEINYAIPIGTVNADMIQGGQFTLASDKTIHSGDTILMANCQYADIVTVDSVVPMADNVYQVTLLTPAQFHYTKHAFVGKVVQLFFYIGDTGRHNGAGEPIYALYMYDQYRRHTESVAGINAMHIGYRIQRQQVIYDDAAKVTAQHHWPFVIAVHISLTITHSESLLSQSSAVLAKTWEIDSNIRTRLGLCNAGLC